MTFECSQTTGRLPATLMILCMALMMAACSSDGGNGAAVVEMPGDGGEPTVAELGEWNSLTAGALDISDANSVLRAYYDEAGMGRVMAEMPVQPAGVGSATWNGRWSGKIELNPDPLAARGLGAYGVNPDELAQLEGEAQVTAYFDGGGTEAALTYMGLGLDELDLTQIASDRVAVTNGRFDIHKTYSNTFEAETTNPFDPSAPTMQIPTTVTGDFAGQGAFGGMDAAGVVGYVGGRMNIDYGRGTTYLGTLQSVFYGTQDDN